MSGVDPRRSFESAARAVRFGRQAAEQAHRAAAHAEVLAQQPARAAWPDASLERAHARAARLHSKSEACQRAAERMHQMFLRRLVTWAAGREDTVTLLRPVLMGAVASTAGWGGAVLTVSEATGQSRLVAASDVTARRVHGLEVALGEGPSWDAMRNGGLAARVDELGSRWPSFGAAAGELGVTSVAAARVDLDHGEGLFGSLTFVGPPAPDMTVAVCGLDQVAEALRQTVFKVPQILRADDADVPLMELLEEEDYRPALHQAAGVLRARFGWDADDGIAMIRAHAFAEGRPITLVAKDIMAGDNPLWS